MAIPSESSIDALVTRLAGAGPEYCARVERMLRHLQAVLNAPRPIRWLAGDLEKARSSERALRLELTLLDGLRDGTLKREARPDGSSVWAIDLDTVKRRFTEKEIA